MCFHCCHLRHTPCPPIPYSCPHCSVREIASACSVPGRKQHKKLYSADKWYIVRKREKYKYPCICNKLPHRWLDVNRNLIFELARLLDKSPEAIHYVLLRLLHANYSQVMRIMKKRRSFEVPLVSHSLFVSPSSLIDEHGKLSAPMHPESVEKLLRLIQDYLHRMQLLNRKYKWFNNGLDKGDLVGLLGELDELLKVLTGLFGGCEGSQSLLSIQRFLQVINNVHLDKLFHKGKTQQKSMGFLKTISDLYSAVAAETPIRPVSKNVTEDLDHQLKIQDSSAHLDITNERISIKTAENVEVPKHTTLSFKPAVSSNKNSPKKYLFGEGPIFVHEPFDAEKAWTWQSRMPQRKRWLPDGTVSTGPVRKYRPTEERNRLAAMSIRSERSIIGGTDFKPTFGENYLNSTIKIQKKPMIPLQRNRR